MLKCHHLNQKHSFAIRSGWVVSKHQLGTQHYLEGISHFRRMLVGRSGPCLFESGTEGGKEGEEANLPNSLGLVYGLEVLGTEPHQQKN